MWRTKQTPQTQQTNNVGRILNRHKRGRPRFRFFQRLKRMGLKLIIPVGIFGAIGSLVWLANWLGFI
jgi:hypothetical protein